MAKAEKISSVQDYTRMMEGKSLIFFNYQGINVADLTSIRNKSREKGTRIKVIKNTYLRHVLKNLSIKAEDTLFTGMSAVAVVENNFSDSAKLLYDAQKAEKISIRGGYYEGSIVASEHVVKLATIPPREVLLSMLVGCLQGPMANLVYTLKAISEQKGGGGATAEPAAG